VHEQKDINGQFLNLPPLGLILKDSNYYIILKVQGDYFLFLCIYKIVHILQMDKDKILYIPPWFFIGGGGGKK
jgi:hypothetical protein